jgi:hypothetical protein
MAREASFREADLSIVLPGTWVSLPMGDDAAAEREIASLVRRQVGRNDRLARVRRDARDQLRGMIETARAAGAFRVGLSLEILPGVPFPAAMILSYQDWPAHSRMADAADAPDAADSADAADAPDAADLAGNAASAGDANSAGNADSAGDVDAADAAAPDTGSANSHERNVTARLRLLEPQAQILPLSAGATARISMDSRLKAGEESTPDVKIRYWLPTPDGQRLLHIAVDAPMAADGALYTELFDAIVDSIRWFDVPTTASATTDAAESASVARG